MTRMDLMILLAILVAFAAFILERTIRERRLHARVLRVQCMANLKAMGSAFRVWAGDNNENFPMSVSQTNSGSKEFVIGMNAFHHFQVMSNELATPKVLLCPADWIPGSNPTDPRAPAAHFTSLGNSNLSYFVGIDAQTTNADMFLLGDRNLTNGIGVNNALLAATTNPPCNWTTELHDGVGNILFADGSVRQLDATQLRAALAKTGHATNLLQMPVTIP